MTFSTDKIFAAEQPSFLGSTSAIAIPSPKVTEYPSGSQH